jgi:hypothetical protein
MQSGETKSNMMTLPIAVVHLLLAFSAMESALAAGIGNSSLHTQQQLTNR